MHVPAPPRCRGRDRPLARQASNTGTAAALRGLLAPAAALLLAAAAVAAPGERGQPDPPLWFSVHLDGRKVGHLQSQRWLEGDEVHSERRLQINLERSGEPLALASSERSIETIDGEPLGFASELDLAGNRSRTEARIVAGQVRLQATEQGRTGTEQRYPWPSGALLAEGQRLALLQQQLEPGDRFAWLAFDPATQRSQQVDSEVLARQPIDIHGQLETLLELRQTVAEDGAVLSVQAWLREDDRSLRRMRLPALGLQLELLACDRECALAPDQPTDVLAATMVPAPRPLTQLERRAALRYRLAVDADDAEAMHGLPGQRLWRDEDGGLQLAVDPAGDALSPPTAADLEATRWLQSDAPELQALARRAVGRERDARRQMERLERRVRRHIAVKSLRIGYASALETYHLREGDCTEHALLLAALARAAGIPARVATGLAYAGEFGGQRHVYVPHAWVFAWIDGRWQGFDAAMPRHDAGHIAFSVDHGDPLRFYRGLQLLGRLQIEAAEPADPPGLEAAP
jgi:hypothetical protein